MNIKPILKQRKSEMITNPLIEGEQFEKVINIYKKPKILIEQNREFTETVNEISNEIYENKKIKVTKKKVKWVLIILVLVVFVFGITQINWKSYMN